MLKLKKSIKVFFLLITAVVLSLGLLACDKNGKIDPNKTYSDVTNSCKLTANYAGKNFLKDGIGEATLTRISDGDTASFKTSIGDYVTIRFYGIDTPESTGQVDKWGVSASLFVKGIINKDTQFVLESSTGGAPEKDSYGVRYLGYVWYRNNANEDWKNLNLLVVENGYSKQSIPNSPAYVYYPYFKNAETNELLTAMAKDKKRNGWFLLRLSVHDPVMPFNTESDTRNGCVEICKTFYDLVKNVKGIDFTTLEDFIKL